MRRIVLGRWIVCDRIGDDLEAFSSGPARRECSDSVGWMMPKHEVLGGEFLAMDGELAGSAIDEGQRLRSHPSGPIAFDPVWKKAPKKEFGVTNSLVVSAVRPVRHDGLGTSGPQQPLQQLEHPSWILESPFGHLVTVDSQYLHAPVWEHFDLKATWAEFPGELQAPARHWIELHARHGRIRAHCGEQRERRLPGGCSDPGAAVAIPVIPQKRELVKPINRLVETW
ncbi:MAG: hypothetical protein KA190_09195 [Kofleriaceae bacterium]|nr:hypothetical protein [Kofleriaceae bacterium]